MRLVTSSPTSRIRSAAAVSSSNPGQSYLVRLVPILDCLAQMGRREFKLSLQLGQSFPGRFDFFLGRAHVLDFALLPVACRLLEPLLGVMKQALDRKSTRLNSSHANISTLSLHDALPISKLPGAPGANFGLPRADGPPRVQTLASTRTVVPGTLRFFSRPRARTRFCVAPSCVPPAGAAPGRDEAGARSEEHTSELQSRQYLHSFPTRRSSDLKATWCAWCQFWIASRRWAAASSNSRFNSDSRSRDASIFFSAARTYSILRCSQLRAACWSRSWA